MHAQPKKNSNYDFGLRSFSTYEFFILNSPLKNILIIPPAGLYFQFLALLVTPRTLALQKNSATPGLLALQGRPRWHPPCPAWWRENPTGKAEKGGGSVRPLPLALQRRLIPGPASLLPTRLLRPPRAPAETTIMVAWGDRAPLPSVPTRYPLVFARFLEKTSQLRYLFHPTTCIFSLVVCIAWIWGARV